jgi:hypothetical protein
VNQFNPWIMSVTDIKIELMDVCKESWSLFFEEKIDRFFKELRRRRLIWIIRNTVKKRVIICSVIWHSD